MEFEWSLFKGKQISAEEIMESFEDAFSLRLLPDANRFASQNRFISLGCSSSGKGIFAVYTSTGKIVRVVSARPMTDEENNFYERKIREYQ
ncbi:MAG: BrnT family toxin [Methylacidiphilales bacterium]|nr:BrnT family toxin [Candidatus Methylacidiphilales bacterium]